MADNRVVVSVDDLKEGMIAAEEVIINNNVLITKGARLTDSIIKKLKDVYLENDLQVYERDPEQENILKESRKELEQAQMTVKRLCGHLENMFFKIKLEGKTDINEVTSFSKKVMEELISPRTMIKNIVIEGSGQDSIYKHSVNVVILSSLLGKWLGFTEDRLNLLAYSAILHDFGKTRISKDILNKYPRLNTEDMEEFKKHPVIAYNLIKNISYLSNSVKYGVLMHHERIDGSGYPLGLKEDKIHKYAKIIAIADTFDYINSNKNSNDPFKALEYIRKDCLGKLDYNYSKIFVDHVANYFFGENVLLNDGRVGKIVHIDTNNLSKPLILCDENFIDLKQNSELKVEGFLMD
ncbi:HD-GYP domain-containing protein [uncultured Clostridium sp.]|uniref:HD-GYP domain-containing protein n=1 Tax=uncultured Clostridium sp. TaxID=59620 RepID=UPI0028F0D66E|nr:HD-GYP domain-containing protein [uncultured Clostridium sp.]